MLPWPSLLLLLCLALHEGGRSDGMFVAPRSRGCATPPSLPRAATDDGAEALLQEAQKLRLEAEAEQALLESRRRLEAARSREVAEAPAGGAGGRARLEEEAARVAEKLEALGPQLRKAEAFLLPERDALRLEVDTLQQRSSEIAAELASGGASPGQDAAQQQPRQPESQLPAKEWQQQAQQPQQREGNDQIAENGQIAEAVRAAAAYKEQGKVDGLTEAQWEELAERVPAMDFEERFDLARKLGSEGRQRLDKIVEKYEAKAKQEEESVNAERVAAAKEAARSLKDKLTFEKIKDMSNEERLELAAKLGPAFGVSVAIVAVCYWSVSLPILLYAFRESTGAWPTFQDFGNLDGVQAAGAVAGVLSVAALLKPVRILVAMALTPWTAENVLPMVPWLGGAFEPPAPPGGKPK